MLSKGSINLHIQWSCIRIAFELSLVNETFVKLLFFFSFCMPHGILFWYQFACNKNTWFLSLLSFCASKVSPLSDFLLSGFWLSLSNKRHRRISEAKGKQKRKISSPFPLLPHRDYRLLCPTTITDLIIRYCERLPSLV